MIEKLVEFYETADAKCPIRDWLSRVKDIVARERIYARIVQLRAGNFGDTRDVGEGVFELRIHYNPGYRVYFGHMKGNIVLLLHGGDKRTQKRDIIKARSYFRDYKERYGK